MKNNKKSCLVGLLRNMFEGVNIVQYSFALYNMLLQNSIFCPENWCTDIICPPYTAMLCSTHIGSGFLRLTSTHNFPSPLLLATPISDHD